MTQATAPKELITEIVISLADQLERMTPGERAAKFDQIFGRVIGAHLAAKVEGASPLRVFWLWPVLDTVNRAELAQYLTATKKGEGYPAHAVDFIQGMYNRMEKHPIPTAAELLAAE